MTDGPLLPADERDEYIRLVLRDVHNDATPEEAASLRQDFDSATKWRETLTLLDARANDKLVKIAAAVKRARVDSLSENSRDLIKYKADAATERGVTMSYRTALAAKLREARPLAAAFARERNEQRTPKPLVAVALDRLDRIEALLERIALALEADA